MLKKLFHYFNQKKISEPQNIVSITISCVKNSDELDIQFHHPDITNYSTENITSIAEQCAKLILFINSSYLKNQLLTMVEEESQNSENTKTKLFFDNIISFYDIFKQEILKNSTNNGPLISPMSVFSNK